MPVLSRLLAVSRPAPADVTLQIEIPRSSGDLAASRDVTITYLPAALVIALFDQDQTLVEHLPSFVVAWDLLDEHGHTCPITLDSIRQLATAEVSAVLNGLVEHEMWRNPDLPPGRKGRVVRRSS